MKFIHGTRASFLEAIRTKRVVLFGASRQPIDAWIDFKDNYNFDITERIEYVVDNGIEKTGTTILFGERSAMVYGVDKLIETLWEDKVILITSRCYLDILRQLDALPELESVEVYAYACIILDRELTIADKYKVRVTDEAMLQYTFYQSTINGNEKEKKHKYEELKLEIEKDGYRVLPRITLMHSNICSLKCKYCCDLIPQSRNHYFLSAKQIISDMEIILRGVDKIMSVDLTDGEIFLYRELDELLEYLLNQNQIETIVLISNGTIMPSENTLKLLSNSKAWVSFSDYKMGNKLEEVLEEMRRYQIKFCVSRDLKWKDMKLEEHAKREEGRDMLRYEFLRCRNKLCSKALINRKLYACMPAFRMSYMDYYHSDKDYVEFYEEDTPDEVWEKIYKICMLDYIDACDYCNFENTGLDYIDAGNQ